MKTLAEMIEGAAAPEPVETAIALSSDERWTIDIGEAEPSAVAPRPWFDVRVELDYPLASYDACHAVFAWSASWVIFVREYDSMYSVRRLPRDPTPVAPCFNGLS